MTGVQYLKIREAAKRASIHVDTLRALIRKGLGPKTHTIDPTRKRPFLRIREDDLQTWLDSLRQ
jgi:DNA-binding transcriptional MerR regulator